jgi:hypothetical protein
MLSDKEINKFYSCISKTHQDPPTIEKLDSCYYQSLGGTGNSGGSGSNVSTAGNYGVTGPSTNPTSTPISIRQHHHKK